jgi:hypothetical protein
MMTLQEVIKVVDTLSPEELRVLRTYLDQREGTVQPALELAPEERARQLDEAFERLREGLTQKQIDEMTEAMNAEYIEPFDEDVWKD